MYNKKDRQLNSLLERLGILNKYKEVMLLFRVKIDKQIDG